MLGERELAARYGRIGARITRLPRAEDERGVDPRTSTHSVSAETTLPNDEADPAALGYALWPLCGRVAALLKQASFAGRTITLKLKAADFRLRTRSHRLADPIQPAEVLFQTAVALLAGEVDGVTRFRLIGVGADALVEDFTADPPTLFDRELDWPRRIEHAMEQIRTRLGDQSVRLGRGLPSRRHRGTPYDISAQERRVIG
jgi:DNA polymerase-4